MTKPDKRSEIMAAALELLAEQGFHGAPMAQIASRAGVGAGTIYCYFAGRDELINEIYREIESRLNLQIEDGIDGLSIRGRFVHFNTVIINYFISNPLEFRYIEQFHNSPYGIEHRRDKIFGREDEAQFCRDLFRDGIANGEVKDLPMILLYAMTFGPILAVARDHILGFVELDAAMIARFVDASWDGIRRHP